MNTDRPKADARDGEIVALIPARGGSKGIPDKNIRLFDGQPLIAYSIRQALQSRLVSRVIVSTDSEKIADVARSCGAEVPFMRPADLADDLSPDIDTFRHMLEWWQANEPALPEMCVHLRPTGPVRRVELIDNAIEMMLDRPDADSLRSVALSELTPFKMWQLDGDFLVPVIELDGVPDAHSMPRQKLPKIYWQNGYVDIVRPRTVLESGSMVGARPLAFVVSEPVYELDYPDDVPRVEDALRILRETGKLPEDDDAKARTGDDRFPV